MSGHVRRLFLFSLLVAATTAAVVAVLGSIALAADPDPAACEWGASSIVATAGPGGWEVSEPEVTGCVPAPGTQLSGSTR